MLNRKEAIEYIFNKHGDDAIYIAPTGFLSRAVHELFASKKNIFYMQGSMGLSSAIGLGLSLFTDKPIVAINGDGGHLMHLGITHTIRDHNKGNLFVYLLDNGCHESVGGYPCSKLENEYAGITKIIKISNDGKCSRVNITFEDNAKNIISMF